MEVFGNEIGQPKEMKERTKLSEKVKSVSKQLNKTLRGIFPSTSFRVPIGHWCVVSSSW